MKHRQNPEPLSMKAQHRSVLAALFLAMVVMVHASVHAFTLTTDMIVGGGGGIGSYRRLMEEDATFHNDPSAPVPDINANALGLNFRPGWDDVIDLIVGASWSVPRTGNQDAAAVLIYGPADVAHPSRLLSGLSRFPGGLPTPAATSYTKKP